MEAEEPDTPVLKEKSFIQRVLLNEFPYSHYAYGLHHAAQLAKMLHIPAISAIEFGVAGGNGLVAMETHAAEVHAATGVTIEVYGFDTGKGLPPPEDFRDMPYRFAKGNYKMNVPKLQARLKTAKLVLGDVKKTVPKFFDKYNPAPIGFSSFDMDYYSSTKAAFRMYGEDQNHKFFLPRAYAYFDDIIGTEISSYNDFVGELAAIHNFNLVNDAVKIAESRVFRKQKRNFGWFHQIYLIHRFKHPLYDTYVSKASAGSLSLED